ncbi:MAG: TlpA family protein disulfide reductase [Gammaproteobacteria bacterium]|nr:TlpA family protein disulfide reductase [Gammaproteobacteria bacterium]MYF38034.1 TlpA family protein disulfide reductase [Gammaproteobacteria bacterium]
MLFVGTYKKVKNHDKKFSVSGIYDLTDGEKAPGHLSATLTSFDYLENGTPVQIEFAEVLLQDGRYLIEAEVDEPRACNLRIFRGTEFVWSTALVIEPNAKIEIARHEHGPSNWLIATAETGRHDKLIDSWHMDKDFLSKGSQMVSAPIQERHARFEKMWEVRTNALKKLAWTSEDPFDSLVALELTGTFFGGDMGLIDGEDKVKLYDKLSIQLDEDVVARRIRPLRDVMAANIARANNLEKMSVGEKAPNIVLDNVNGEKIDLSDILSEANLVLVEFWASWCAPCIAKFPTLKSLYAEYQDAGFEVMTVSLDTSVDDWKRASENHKLPWYDVGDEKGFFGPSAVDFGVEGVPTNYLLDGEGLIVEKNTDLEQLERLLEAQLSTTSESN